MRPIEVNLHGQAAIEFAMSMVVAPLAHAWDGALDRVAFVYDGKVQGRVDVGFVDRAKMIAQLGRWAARAPAPMAAEMHNFAATLERGPTDRLQCIFHALGALALVEMPPDELRAMRDLPTTGSTAGDFALAVHEGASREGACAIVGRARAAIVAALAVSGSPPAPDALHGLDALARAIDDRWDDRAAVIAAAKTAIDGAAPLTPTADGQRALLQLAGLAEAMAQRPPPGTTRAPGGAA